MKLHSCLAVAALCASLLVGPAVAGGISDVDHPDVPNCVLFPASGHNAPDCETLTFQAVYAHNGQGARDTHVSAGKDGILGTADDIVSHSYSW